MHVFWDVFTTVCILMIVWSMWIQRKALHKVAWGRSMFISWAAIIMGLMVGMLPTFAHAFVSAVLLIMGVGMFFFMGIKSYQYLKRL